MRLTPLESLRNSTDIHADAVDLGHLAFSTVGVSELSAMVWGTASKEDITTHCIDDYEAGLLRDLKTPAISAESTDGLGSNVDRTEHFVIRDMDLPQIDKPDNGRGRIIAHASWIYCPSSWAEKNTYHPNEKRDKLVGPHAKALQDYYMKETYRISKVHTTGIECYILIGISTASSHGRQGIATKLVQWIFPIADASNRPVWLTASPAGAPVYLRNGFVRPEGPDGAVTIPLGDWGGTKDFIHHHIAMERKPNK